MAKKIVILFFSIFAAMQSYANSNEKYIIALTDGAVKSDSLYKDCVRMICLFARKNGTTDCHSLGRNMGMMSATLNQSAVRSISKLTQCVLSIEVEQSAEPRPRIGVEN